MDFILFIVFLYAFGFYANTLRSLVCPTIYVGELSSFEEVMKYALEVISREVPSINMENILDKDYILGHVRAQMVSAGNVILEPGITEII